MLMSVNSINRITCSVSIPESVFPSRIQGLKDEASEEGRYNATTCFNSSDSPCPFPMGPAAIYLSNCIFKKEEYADLLKEVGSELILIPRIESIILIPLLEYGHVNI